MKVKLDENVPRRAALTLAQAGHDVDTVVDEGMTGAADQDVVRAATAGGRLLITLDRGLGDLRTFPPGAHTGILVLRPGDQSASSVDALLEQLTGAESLGALVGTVAVAQPGLLRIRRPGTE